MGRAPLVAASTREERLAYLRERYVCIANCDMCGICATFHGTDPEQALAAYVDGQAELSDVLRGLRR